MGIEKKMKIRNMNGNVYDECNAKKRDGVVYIIGLKYLCELRSFLNGNICVGPVLFDIYHSLLG